MPEPTQEAPRRHRPRAVSFVASLLLLEAVLVVLAGVVAFAAEIETLPLPAIGLEDALGPIANVLPGLSVAVAIVVAGGGLALAGIGLLQLRESGWVLAMALQGLGLANALHAHLNGSPQHVALALCSFVVLVLNQREVRQAFQVPTPHA